MSLRHRALRSAPLIGFGLAIVFLTLSLYGYDPADPPGRAPSRPTSTRATRAVPWAPRWRT